MTSAPLRIALVQMSCEAESQRNLDKALTRISEAAARGAKVICLQELFRSRYFCQSEEVRSFDLAEPIPGPTTEALGAVAAARKVVVVGSIFERRTEGIYHNTAVVMDADGRRAGRRADRFLSHGDRMGARRGRAGAPPPASGLGDGPARSRDRQWDVRRGGQSGGPGGQPGVLGQLVRGRSVRRGDRARRRQRGGNSRRRLQSRAYRRDPAQLAVPA